MKDKIILTVNILVGIIAGGFILSVGAQYVLPATLPFLIAWLVAFAVKEPSRGLSKRLHIPERVIRPVFALLIALVGFSVLGFLIWQIIALIWELLTDIGAGNGPVYELLKLLASEDFSLFGDGFPEELSERISGALESILSSALSFVAGAITSWAGSVPKILLFLLVTVISLVYFAIDLEKINSAVRKILPSSVGRFLSLARRKFFSVFKKYIGSYVVIFIITYVVMLLGFLVLGIEKSPLIALIVAALDILPVIGVGTVLVPWSIFLFATGEHVTGVGLVILFIVNTVIREVAEPKIIGKNLGIHPILSLALIYIGYALFGFAGLILTPLIAVAVGFLIEK
ncbi:MAG: AI-2E family transporter [Clostridia bacterium]|nr:AI-2E family transporter [Clostridia bacterium]